MGDLGRARAKAAGIRRSLAQPSVKARFGASLVPSIGRALLATSGAGGAIENRIREQGSADRTAVGAYRHRKTPQTRGFSEERRTRLELATLSLGS
jgi:hypothetical protein